MQNALQFRQGCDYLERHHQPGVNDVRCGGSTFHAQDGYLEPHADGTILPVRAHPARRNEIRGVQDGMLKVSVTQAPEKGKANKAVIELLSKKLGLKKSQIELIAGETSHQKRFLVREITPDELAERFRGLPASGGFGLARCESLGTLQPDRVPISRLRGTIDWPLSTS